MVTRYKVSVEEKDGVELEYNEEAALDSENVFFDSSSLNEIDDDNLQDLGETLATKVGASASPGFSFGRSANVSNSWLLITGSVPSNKTGIPVAIVDAEITLISVGNENVSTFDIEVYEHEGDQINLTLLGTVSLVGKRTDNFAVSYAVSTGKQVAVRVVNGSGKNVGVFLQLKGSSV
tara:strand:- start:4657 stop:5190 length:534 start_codon:yes stop_codon:yes gene_type:complete